MIPAAVRTRSPMARTDGAARLSDGRLTNSGRRLIGRSSRSSRLSSGAPNRPAQRRRHGEHRRTQKSIVISAIFDDYQKSECPARSFKNRKEREEFKTVEVENLFRRRSSGDFRKQARSGKEVRSMSKGPESTIALGDASSERAPNQDTKARASVFRSSVRDFRSQWMALQRFVTNRTLGRASR